MARPDMSRATAVAAAETEEDEAATDVSSVAEVEGGSEGPPPLACDGWGEATIGAAGDGAMDGGERAGLGATAGGATYGAGDGEAAEGEGDGAAVDGVGDGVAAECEGDGTGAGVAAEREGDGTGAGVAAENEGDGARNGVATDGATAAGDGVAVDEARAAGAGEGLPPRAGLRGAMTTMTSFSPFWQLVALPLMK